MQRQLNPQLFGTAPSNSVSSSIFKQEFQGLQSASAASTATLGAESQSHIKSLENKIESLSRSFQETQNQIMQNFFQTEESLKALRLKTDRIQSLASQTEKNQESLSIETSQKIHFIQQKYFEQKKLEDSVQNLVDRQNNLLKGYEVRLLQLQKLIAEKEAQLVSTMAALNETKMDLQRIKRG